MPESDGFFEELAKGLHHLSEDVDRLAPVVEGLFRQATKRFSVPTPSGCRMVALYMIGLRNYYRTDNEYELDNGPSRRLAKPKVIKTGELFLRQLSQERKVPQYWLSLMSQGRPVEAWRRYYQRLLDGIDQTREHIAALLPDLWPQYNSPDPIRQIAAVATLAWQEANGGKAPRSASPGDPVCKFVEKALTEIGLGRSEAEISEVLRGRRRKRKDGPKL